MMSRRNTAEHFDAALRGRRGDADVRELVRVAESLCAAAAEVGPSRDFRLALRERLLVEAGTVLEPAARPAARVPSAQPATPVAAGFRRRAARLSAAAIVAVGGVGLVASSAQALPGDLLYSVKRGVENVELALHRSPEARGEFQLSQARERLAEAEALAQSDEPVLAAESLDDFTEQAESGSADLFAHYDEEGGTSSVEEVNTFALEASDTLASLSGTLPTGDDASLTRAADTVRQIVDQARQLCTECSSPELVEFMVAPEPAVTPTVDPSTTSQGTPAPSAAAPAPRPSSNNTPAPAAAPVVPSLPVVPSPTPTSAGIPVVTPLVNGLLGSGEQEGLVPGLLNGLLGGT